MKDRDKLLRDNRAEIIWSTADIIKPFTERISLDALPGFISVDVDIHSATKSALQCLTDHPEKYTAAVSMYFDDVSLFSRRLHEITFSILIRSC